MLNEQLKRRNNTYEEDRSAAGPAPEPRRASLTCFGQDIASLYEILKGAKNPADLLMAARPLEEGEFREAWSGRVNAAPSPG